MHLISVFDKEIKKLFGVDTQIKKAGRYMGKEIIDILIPVISGSLAGYLTNTYAINMLFKEYTPLKLGGVVKKTKAEFIEEMSQVVEKDIINSKNIETCFENEQFNMIINQTIKDFFEKSLIKEVEGNTIENIADYEDTQNALKEHIFGYINNNTAEIKSLLLQNIQMLDLSKSETLKSFIKDNDKKIKDFLNSEKSVELFVSEMFNLFRNMKIKEIITIPKGKLVLDKEIIKECIQGIDIDNLFKSIFGTKFEELLQNELNSKIFNKSVNQILKLDKEVIAQKLLPENIFNEILNQLLDNLKTKGNLNIKEIFLENSLENLMDKMDQVASDKTGELTLWLSKNRETVESFLQSTLDEVISETIESRPKFTQGILENKSKNIIKEYAVLDKIIEGIENENNISQLIQNIKQTAISSIDDIDLNNFYNKIDTQKIQAFSNALITPIYGQIENYLSKNISELFTPEQIKDFVYQLKLVIISQLKHKLTNSELLYQQIEEIVASYVDNFMDKKLEMLITNEKLPKVIESIEKLIAKNNILNYDLILKWINDSKNKIAIFDILFENIEDKMIEQFEKIYIEKELKLRKSLLSDLIKHWNENTDIERNVSEKLTALFKKEIGDFTEGKVASIVKSNLEQLNEDELCELVHEFIGKELGPITYFGAVLGAGAGLGLGFLSESAVPVQMAVYALVGWATNFIALQMLFRPYNKKVFLSKIPGLKYLSQGYIIKNKDAFARNLGEVIENELLNSESVQILFEKYKEELRDSLIEDITKSQREKFNEILSKYEPAIANAFTEYIYKQVDSENMLKLDELVIEEGMVSHKGIESLLNKMFNSFENTDILNRILNSCIQNISADYMELSKKIMLGKSENILKSIDAEKVIDNLDISNVVNETKICEFIEKAFINFDTRKISSLSKSLGDFEFINTMIDANTLIDKGVDMLQSHRYTLAASLNMVVTKNLGFFQKIAFSSINGNVLVEKLVEKLIDEKLPELINEYGENIKGTADNLIRESVNIYSIEDIVKAIDREYIYNNIFKNTVSDSVDKNLSGLVKNTKYLLKKGISNNNKIFEENLIIIIQKIIKEIQFDSKTKLELNQVVQRIIADIATQAKISPNNIKANKEQIITFSTNVLYKFLKKSFEKQKISDIIEVEYLKHDFVNYRIKEQILESKVLREYINNLGIDIITDTSWIQAETEKYLVEKTVNSAVESLGSNIGIIVQHMNLKDITIKEIEGMEAKKIHQLFKNFAGKYFRKLEAYGLIGGMFGVHNFAGLIIGIVYFLKQTTKKIGKDKRL